MTDEAKMVQWSVSLPPAAQYAKGDMLNVKGETVEQVEEMLDLILSGDFITKASDVGTQLRAAAVITEGFSPSTSASASTAPSQAPAATPPGGDHFCSHGKRDYREGYGKKGKWAGWFCPTPKGAPDKCEVEWA